VARICSTNTEREGEILDRDVPTIGGRQARRNNERLNVVGGSEHNSQVKKRLLLYLSRSGYSGNTPIASTLAWLCKSKRCLFDNYYDSYHQGVHFPGGDSRNLELGQLTGGTVLGNRHFEEFYYLLLNFDVSVVSSGETMFLSSTKNLNLPVVARSERISVIYREVFKFFGVPLPSDIVMIGCHFGGPLAGLDAYLYPEIYHRQAIGVPDAIRDEELRDLYGEKSTIFLVYVDEKVEADLVKRGYEIEVIDRLERDDDYLRVTRRLAQRWKKKTKGWILGDPVLVSHWLPKACEEGLMGLYSIPQEKILSQLGDLISSKGKVVYGRQYSDRDFFELSKLNQCFQVIDPCRPPFHAVKHVDYTWHGEENRDGFYNAEYSDEELRAFAKENRILISLMFWSGMIRETENFYNLLDLFAMTHLRCGLVLTAQSYEYTMHSPFELLTIPVEQGGVYPLVEPVLGSCGIGVGIECHMTTHRLKEDLREGLTRIRGKVKRENYIPRGWWVTLDTGLEKLNLRERPKPVRLLRYPPYFQIRFHGQERRYEETSGSATEGHSHAAAGRFRERVKRGVRRFGLTKYFDPYRPYEFYRAGPMEEDVVEAAKSAGITYMFTKAGFNSFPKVNYLDEEFVALNYTAGQWDGWTPFETINDVSDLSKSEKILSKRNKPGWIVSTVDSCLWTFSGEFWRRGTGLYEIARFCANGGKSQRLINVKPFTISRYARIIAEENREARQEWT
jgi:hypothetical protein